MDHSLDEHKLSKLLSLKQKLYRPNGEYFGRITHFGYAQGREAAFMKSVSGSELAMYESEIGSIAFTRKQLEERKVPRGSAPDDEPTLITLQLGHRLFGAGATQPKVFCGAITQLPTPNKRVPKSNRIMAVTHCGVRLTGADLTNTTIGNRYHGAQP